MDELTTLCLNCRATRTLDRPDEFLLPSGEIIPADGSPEDMEVLRDYMRGLPCPSCGERRMRLTLPRTAAD